MLNFLGYAAEQAEKNLLVPRRMAIALAYSFGIRSALKNGLIEEIDYGFGLTDLGRELAVIGREQRDSKIRDKSWWTSHAAKAQALFDERQSA
jgi:hypothetical protein